MNRVLYISVVAVSLLAGGCKINLWVPLNEITYPGPVSVSSSMSAKVVVIPGGGRQTGNIGPVIPGFRVSIFFAPDVVQIPETNRELARRFDELLRKELTRLGLFSTIVYPTDKQPTDMVITIFYADLVYNIFPDAEFVVDVVMQITGGSQPFWNRYQVVSTEKDPPKATELATIWRSEAKTHKLLLEKVIPDIEAYVAANNKSPRPPETGK